MLSRESIQKFKDVFEKESGKEMTWEDASESAHNLIGLFEVLIKCNQREQERKKKLEDYPKGFYIEDGVYNCLICGDQISNGQTWHDKYGIKCLTCQSAIDKKIIPGSVARDKDSWYSKYELEDRFNINRQSLKEFIKQGILKPRNIPEASGRTHLQVFIIEDNRDTLPPKKLTKIQLIKEEKDGKTWFRSEPWYRFVDPYKHLKDYKIINYLEFINKEDKDNQETKIETMKIKDIFQIGGIMQSFRGADIFLDQNNCVVFNKSRNEDAVILHLKRESDEEEGNIYLRVKDEFKSIKNPLLNWLFISKDIIGLTINQLESLNTNIEISIIGSKLDFRQKND
jgi:DNA-directed RNA polymerase subunit RPC12/RpoP